MKVTKTMTAIELFKAAGAAHGMATQTQFISSAIGDDQYGITSWRLEKLKNGQMTRIPKHAELSPNLQRILGD